MNIFKFEIKRGLKSLLYWSVGISLVIIVFMSLFPSMESLGMKDLLSGKLEGLPTNMLEAFNISSGTDFSNISDYLAYTIQYVVMASAIYGSILGVSSIIEEESEGTIEFLYSKPVSRMKLLWSKILSRSTIFMLYVLIVYVITIGISLVVKPAQVDTMNMINDITLILIGLGLVGYIFMAVGILISTLLKRGKAATSIGLSLFFFTYVLGIISKLKDNFEFAKYFSPYDWFLPSNAIGDGFEVKYIIIGIVIIFISLLSASYIYKSKDMNIN